MLYDSHRLTGAFRRFRPFLHDLLRDHTRRVARSGVQGQDQRQDDQFQGQQAQTCQIQRQQGQGQQVKKRPAERTQRSKRRRPDAKKDAKKDAGDHKVAPKPVQVASYGDWGGPSSRKAAKTKPVYALASPKDRIPAGLQRDPAYVFISSRPAENVRNEISIIMGFPMKENAEARAEIGSAGFDLISKGMNAWVKNPAEEGQFIDAMKKGAKLVVKAPSLKGNVTTDSYSLAGFSQALDRVVKDCP